MTQFYDIVKVCEILEENTRSKFSSYGIDGEYVSVSEGYSKGRSLKSRPSLKPSLLYRGQHTAYHTLQASIFRKYGLACTWEKGGIWSVGNGNLLMPYPHYSAELECDFYYSCIKAVEVVDLLKEEFPDYPKSVDGHALCQHYGLSTHYLDFSEDLWIAGYFASHLYPNFDPVVEGIGVLYVLNRDILPNDICYEIGIQPLARPFAQRGWLLRTYPRLNLADQSFIQTIYFQHNKDAGNEIARRFGGGERLVPHGELTDFVTSCLRDCNVKQSAVGGYLEIIRKHGGQPQRIKKSILRLFEKRGVEIV